MPRKKKPITKTRKKVKDELDMPLRYKLIDDYIKTDMTPARLGEKYNISTIYASKIIDTHLEGLINSRNAKDLLKNQEIDHKGDKTNYHISLTKCSKGQYFKSLLEGEGNERFLGLLSEDDSPVVTKYEAEFAWLWVYGSSSLDAIKGSGLTAGLSVPKGKTVETSKLANFKNACALRALYIRKKPNVMQFIKDIQAENLKNMEVSKPFIQNEILRELEELREDKDIKARREFGKNIDRLANTIGAYSNNINITHANAANALDRLVDLAKADATDNPLPEGQKADYIVSEKTGTED